MDLSPVPYINQATGIVVALLEEIKVRHLQVRSLITPLQQVKRVAEMIFREIRNRDSSIVAVRDEVGAVAEVNVEREFAIRVQAVPTLSIYNAT